ncbi:hypothetical protein B0H13DRAFT_2035146 [Mycena leptocephala]|nr:hypothetical protein B0H13DRAFT_2035146 [Mycena leptocephala]
MGGGPVTSSSISGPLGTLSATATSIEDRLAILRRTMKAPLPGTAGVHPVGVDDLVVYYDVDPVSSRSVTWSIPKDLLALANAWSDTEPGVKAIDATKFAIRFDVVASGLLDVISTDVLQGETADGNKFLRAELLGMNVYGPGAFIKAQKSMRHHSIIGSLVVIFPIIHAGGRYIVQHENETWSLDPCAELSGASTPAISYLALYWPEVLYAMEPVDLGYRVTLNYNLSLVDRNAGATVVPSISTATDCLLENTIRALLADPAFLPSGGFLADDFDPTQHYNALNEWVTTKTPANRWGAVLQSLKGGDARMREVSQRVGLMSFVKLLYAPRNYTGSPDDRDVLLDDIVDLFGIHEGLVDCFPGEDLSSTTAIAKQGVILQRDRHRIEELKWMRVDRWALLYPHMMHEWSNLVRTAYIGSDTMVEHQYGTAALFIQVPAVGQGIRSS